MKKPENETSAEIAIATYIAYLADGTMVEEVEEIPVYVTTEWHPAEPDIQEDADSPCPCCGNITIPNGGDALGYICPICYWEIDLFIKSDDEPSDQNHGITLNQARENYKQFGKCWKYL